MPVQKLVATLGAALVCTLPLGALQSAMTEDEYEAAMKEINFIVGDMELHIDARYWPELFEDLGKLRTQFEQVEAFWAARGTDEAAGFARNVIEGIAPIAAAADESNSQEAMSAVRALRTTCQACHEGFREQGDGGYRIKQ